MVDGEQDESNATDTLQEETVTLLREQVRLLKNISSCQIWLQEDAAKRQKGGRVRAAVLPFALLGIAVGTKMMGLW